MNFPLFKVHMPVEEALAGVREVLESGFVNEGVQVTEFQKALTDFLGTRNLVLTNACTSALTIAYKLAGVEPGTEVVTTAMTCVATNTPIVNLGANIVWADIDPLSGSIIPSDIERKITDRTRAIAYVNWAGTPCDLEAIYEVGQRHGIPVIQDAAHAFGAKWKGKSVCHFADFTCYSFQAIKHLSSGDGGAIVCRDDEHYVLARKLKWFGYDREAAKDEKGEWKGQRWSADILPEEVGYKFNMNNVSAAIGLAQMPHIEGLLGAHRANGAVYNEAFAATALIEPIKVPADAISSYWVYTCLFSGTESQRDALIERLNAEGIAAGLVHLSNDIYTAFQPFEADLPGTREFGRRQISLPCGWWMSEADCRLVADRVLSIAAGL
ncbi:DegT/DnrJ/EryC1/StrS family aminotransferase [Nitrogeniibacter aestuarii]|uniref:DegT/DnrJ/EryC1/StrS family aminotransferase n=1 Tax=Nitrogeniibacter aestuarii TaxID=2815343 RepID=UPI001D11CEAC|nr:DegT/DnrJ/EryC1/StrS family aminotransferase [Nitrogeniibacter aestuarii]